MSRYTERGILLLALLLLLAAPASSASEEYFQGITAFNYTAPAGLSIYQVNLYNLDAGITSLSLDAYGVPYALEVNCTRSWGWWNYDVGLVYPNGTTISQSVSTLQPFATDYDIRVQYATSDLDTILDVDLYTSFFPASVYFDTRAFITHYIWFSEVSGSSPDPMDARIYLGNAEDLQAIENHDPLAQFSRSVGSIFVWSWDMVIAFSSMIPFVGEYFAGTLELVGAVIGEIFWYLEFFLIKEPEVTVMFIEVFCIGEAIIASKGGTKGGITYLMKRVLDNHIRAYQFFVSLVKFMVTVITEVINVISSIIQALKPI